MYISTVSKEVAIYINGFVVHKLLSKINSKTGLQSLCSNYKETFNSLNHLKNREGDKGGLNYRSGNVIIICLQTEKINKSLKIKKFIYYFYSLKFFIISITQV